MGELSTKRSAFIAFSVGGAYIGWGLLLSLQPSFYPTEAEKKGATPSQYGFVFGVINLAALIFAPIFSHYGHRIGPKLLYNTGAVVQGLVGFSFGFLVYCNNTFVFIGLSYALRFVDGVAEAAAWGAVVSILMKIYPSKVTTIMSWTEMCFGMGYMLGPAVGSGLYMVGGFLLPFLVVGTWCLFIAVCIFFAIPSVKVDDKDGAEEETVKMPLTLRDLAKSPSILLPYFDNFVCLCGAGMIESMLEPYMKQMAGATQMDVGNTFLTLGALYMVTSPVTGYICDKIKYPTVMSILGNVFMAVAFLFYGPVPFINVAPSVPIILAMGGLTGIGNGLIMVSTFGRAQSAAIRKGFNDDIDTYLICSGMWSASFFFGNFLGPTAAGFAVESYGFASTTMVFFFIYCLVIMIDCLELTYNVKQLKKKQGYEQLR